MGLFKWLGELLDDLIEWLTERAKVFLEALMNALQKVWPRVSQALSEAFGAATNLLYAIFYAGTVIGETIMEVWDPRYYNTKPSQVFNLKQAPQDSPLPIKRGESKVMELRNF